MRLTRPALVAIATLTAGPALADSVNVEGVQNDDLREAIVAAMPKFPDAPETLFDARRRAESAADDALNVLYAEGYYGATVDHDALESPKLIPYVMVNPGPLFLFKPAQVVLAHDVDEKLAHRVRRGAQLREGAAATGAAVINAEAAGLDALRKGGYAEAETLEREAVADHADNSLAVTFRYNPGPRIRLGALRIDGETKTDLDYIESLRSWTPGDLYTPAALDTLTDRAADTSVFDSGSAALAPAGPTLPPGEAAPLEQTRDVILTLKDRKPRTVTLGGSYSTSEGLGFEGTHVWRNLRGQADSVTLSARVAELERVLSGEIAYPHWRRPDHTLKLGTGFTQSETDAFDQRKVSVSAGVETDIKLKYGFGYGANLDAAHVRDATGEKDLYIAGLFGNLRVDRTNNLLDPRRGYRAELRMEPAVVTGDDRVVFLKTTATASTYKTLDKKRRFVAAGRLRLGSIAGAPLTGVPADYRFFAGGGGSVRGFDHQALSPSTTDVTRAVDTKFVAFGGRSLIESSLEVRWRINQKWGAVGFLDAGAAGEDSVPDLGQMRAGIGAGVRYYTDFGPLRFDLATPLDRKDGESAVQFYVSIGQSF